MPSESSFELVQHRRGDREEQARQLGKRLDTIRLDRCTLVDGHFDRLRSDREYEETFREAGLSPFVEEAKVVADRIKESPGAAAPVAALDDWAVCAANSLRRASLLVVARLADPDPLALPGARPVDVLGPRESEGVDRRRSD